ncbi:N-acetyl-gamma-glutamyl-phosphate reductase [Naasia lichenicola]|uniref:N-acetyl-gamma-glutamyl-phosphate reductase n=1 Tax=Naasia lichenicola TaxID=2565933 RepID=A0A4S4FP20_9MICO|nr:N-acetyl-gamma-glutamyl-phosphate reductase [Naasia lichenicola]THG32269.1 N-acetyl-gamma-glutamyl-phosphate reductase [Naasia lichenicola]
MPLSVAVAGASGYAGGELLRLLAGHPEFSIGTLTAHSNAGQSLVSVQPHLRSLAGHVLVPTDAHNLAGHDVVFLALPHGASAAIAAELDGDTLVIDCGADHRLESSADWAAFYSGDHAGTWAYGVPELPLAPGIDPLHLGATKQRERIVGTRRIAAPGCNASTVALSIAPGIAAGVIQPTDIVSVLAVGPSGAGRALKQNLLAGEILGSANPYGIGGVHRHIPEILQSLRWAGAVDPTISFTPVLVPMSRGILATSTAVLTPGVTAAEVRAAWELAYAGEPFVQLLPAGEFPRTADVLGANTALLGLAIDEAAGRVVVIAAVDNLAKGTAGAAIQSANIALGFEETLGLPLDGVAP